MFDALSEGDCEPEMLAQAAATLAYLNGLSLGSAVEENRFDSQLGLKMAELHRLVDSIEAFALEHHYPLDTLSYVFLSLTRIGVPMSHKSMVNIQVSLTYHTHVTYDMN